MEISESGVPEGEMSLSTEFKWCESVVEAELRSDLSGDDQKSKLSACVSKLRRVAELLEKMDLYSANEELDELSTYALAYLLAPAYLAYAVDAFNDDVREETGRIAALQEAKSLYRHFLESLLLFNLVGFDLPWLRRMDNTGDGDDEDKPAVVDSRDFGKALASREEKIRRHNQLAQLEETRTRLAIEQRRNNDESSQRELIIVLLRLWAIRAIGELGKIDGELQLLDYAVSIKSAGGEPTRVDEKLERKKIPLFTIVKSAARKQVLGAGYPAVPTVTVDEWFDQMQREQAFGLGKPMCAQMKPRTEKPEPSWTRRGRHEEELEDHDEDGNDDEQAAKDDEENRPDEGQDTRRERREKDEWRDTHRRGWGNTHNKG